MRASVPRLLGWSCGERNAALLTRWVGGRSVYADVYATLLPRFFVHAHFGAAIDWLIEFQDASRTKARLDLDHEQRIVAECAGGSPEIEETCAHALRQIRNVAPPRTLRLVASHGDFWPRNVILDGHAGMAGVVDWERFSPRSSPFDDLFHFPAAYGMAYRWYGLRNEEESWTRTFVHRNHVSRAVRRFLARYCLRRGLHPSLLLPLLQLHLIKRHRDAKERAETTDGDDTVWMQGLRVLTHAGGSLFSG
jgi:aminoglycoside phosphotransferase (APT) family kinase protein